MKKYIDTDGLKDFYKPYSNRGLKIPVDVILANIDDMPAAEPLTAADLLELEHRFGRDVREVVEDMLKGEGKRWQST